MERIAASYQASTGSSCSRHQLPPNLHGDRPRAKPPGHAQHAEETMHHHEIHKRKAVKRRWINVCNNIVNTTRRAEHTGNTVANKPRIALGVYQRLHYR